MVNSSGIAPPDCRYFQRRRLNGERRANELLEYTCGYRYHELCRFTILRDTPRKVDANTGLKISKRAKNVSTRADILM